MKKLTTTQLIEAIRGVSSGRAPRRLIVRIGDDTFRLHQCGLPACRKIFWHTITKASEAARHRRYCCLRHKLETQRVENAARQKRYQGRLRRGLIGKWPARPEPNRWRENGFRRKNKLRLAV